MCHEVLHFEEAGELCLSFSCSKPTDVIDKVSERSHNGSRAMFVTWKTTVTLCFENYCQIQMLNVKVLESEMLTQE